MTMTDEKEAEARLLERRAAALEGRPPPPENPSLVLPEGRATGPEFRPADKLSSFDKEQPWYVEYAPDILGGIGSMIGGAATAIPGGGGLKGAAKFLFQPKQLAGGAAGVAAGSAIKEGISGSTMEEGFRNMAGEVIENAAFDVGGNLVFGVGGQLFKISAAKVRNFFNEPLENLSAKKAAQEILTKEGGAGLTLFQTTESIKGGLIDAISRPSLLGRSVYEDAAKRNTKALQETKEKLINEFSKHEFDRAGFGTSLNDFVKEGQQALSDYFKKEYAAFSQKSGITVNPAPINRIGEEILELSKRTAGLTNLSDSLDSLGKKMANLGLAKVQVQSPPVQLGSFKTKGKVNLANSRQDISFEDMHEIRSSVIAVLRDMKTPGAAPNTKLKAKLSEVAATIENMMKQAAIGTNHYDTYRLLSNSYKEAQESLFGETLVKALQSSPEYVGSSLFKEGNVTSLNEFTRSINEAASLIYKATGSSKQDVVRSLTNDLRRGYLEELMKSEAGYSKLFNKFDDPEFRDTFKVILGPNGDKIKDLLYALKQSNVTHENFAVFPMQSRAIGAGARVLETFGGLVLANQYSDLDLTDPKVVTTLAGAGALLLTPRVLAKISTDKELISAILGIATSPKQNLGKTAIAKILEMMSENGVTIEDFRSDLDKMFQKEQQSGAGSQSTSEADLLEERAKQLLGR